MKAIIVDDEAKSRRMLSALCEEYCEDLEISGTASSVAEAKSMIELLQPDLVFLDISMPEESGFSLLKNFPTPLPFEVILTTAYDQYALQAFKYSAIDYLLKPIDIDALINAVEKVKLIKGAPSFAQRFRLLKESLASKKIDKIALTTQDGLTFFRYDEIIHCEASGNYTTFHFTDGSSLLITKTLGHYEKFLLEKNFFRIHKSHLINLKHLRRYIKSKQGSVEMSNGDHLDVAMRKREALLNKLREQQ